MKTMYTVITRTTKTYKVCCITEYRIEGYIMWSKQVERLKKSTNIKNEEVVMLFEVNDTVNSGIKQLEPLVGKTIKSRTEEERIIDKFCKVNSGTTGTVIEYFDPEEEIEED